MVNTNWQDFYDKNTNTRIRVAPEVLRELGREEVLRIALHLKARNPTATPPRAIVARAYPYTSNGLQLMAGVFLLSETDRRRLADGTRRVSVIWLTSRKEWSKWCEGREERN